MYPYEHFQFIISQIIFFYDLLSTNLSELYLTGLCKIVPVSLKDLLRMIMLSGFISLDVVDIVENMCEETVCAR